MQTLRSTSLSASRTTAIPNGLEELLSGLDSAHEDLRMAAQDHDAAMILRATSATLFWSEQLLRDLGRLQEAAILHKAQVHLP